MAAFGKQLSEVDIAAVVTYERNAWGNNKGDMVTPKDVLASSRRKANEGGRPAHRLQETAMSAVIDDHGHADHAHGPAKA
jgi:hypothetical protein